MSNKLIAAESDHWYTPLGLPCYEVRGKNGAMRSTNISDARVLGLYPSVTQILRCAAAPGLEAWKARQLLESALTLPQLAGESLDDYAKRVVEDSKEQARKASERGTALHKAIEDWIKGQTSFEFPKHVDKVYNTLYQHGIDLTKGIPEHTFASKLGYGGKLDFKADPPLVLDFKTKDEVTTKKKLAYDNHIQQLSAYGFGLGFDKFRAISVFIGIEDTEVRVHEWTQADICKGFHEFLCLFNYWKSIKQYYPGENEENTTA